VGVPSGDFGGQEYGSNAEVKQFCESKFGIKFPMAEKAVVKGPKAIPLYKWAANTLGEDKTPQWNFHKYLIGKDGRLIAAFGTKTTPTSPEVTAAVAKALATGN
jgi:glutathione peroxidase